MAGTRSKASKTPARTTRTATKKEPAKKVDGGKRERAEEKEFIVPFSGGTIVSFRVTIASAPKVGPGPRPKHEEMLLIRRIDENRVLTISAEPGRMPAGGIKIGSGGPPTGGN